MKNRKNSTSDSHIDCDAKPFIPNGWSVVEHQKMGDIKLNPSKIKLYLSKKQKSGNIRGDKLREELKDKKVLNANVLDYLLENPDIIPEEWKKDEVFFAILIFFWGTIYRSSGGRLYVRYLYWHNGWNWNYHWLDGNWDANNPSAVLAS